MNKNDVGFFFFRTNLELELVHRGGNLCSGGASAAAKRSCLSKSLHADSMDECLPFQSTRGFYFIFLIFCDGLYVNVHSQLTIAVLTILVKIQICALQINRWTISMIWFICL